MIKLLIMQLPPSPCYLVSPRPKHSPQHPILKHPQPVFLRQCQRPSVTSPIKRSEQLRVTDNHLVIWACTTHRDIQCENYFTHFRQGA
jgi:hypothetical protein